MQDQGRIIHKLLRILQLLYEFTMIEVTYADLRKEIKDECSKCGEVLQCELFLQGHGIKRDRENVTEMVSCQMEHQKSRLDKEPKEDLPVKEKCELPPEIKEIYTEVWKIHKECANPKTDDDWSYLIRQGNLLIKIHNNSQFAKALVMAMIDEIEGRTKKKCLDS